MVFGALVLKLSVWCGAEGCVFGLRAAGRKPDTQPSAVASSWQFISTYTLKFVVLGQLNKLPL